MEEWLITSPIQDSSGGVSGWLDDAGKPAFIYGEITGYYLSAMAFVGRYGRRRAAAAVRARRAVSWLDRESRHGEPPRTRVYSTGDEDWRNDLIFSFDLGMVIRGLRAVRPYLPDQADELIHRYASFLRAMWCAGQPIDSHLARFSTKEPPTKWSTVPGPHHVKVAAGVADLPNMRDLAEITLSHWLPFADQEPRELALHPCLYFLEGLVQLGHWDAAGRMYRHILSRGFRDGLLPSQPPEGFERSDVVAQALRMAVLLDSRGISVPQDDIELLVDTLRLHLRDDGAVAFHRPRSDGNHWNCWSAMFGYQAMWLYQRHRAGLPIDNAMVSLII